MQLEELKKLIEEAKWFSCLNTPTDNCLLASQSESWDWLPSSREQIDPINGDTFASNPAIALPLVKTAMTSMRPLPNPIPGLIEGPHDYSYAAKGSAQFAIRMASREISNNLPGQWCNIIELYNLGRWPCGLSASGSIVIW